ncbi:GNAT family N-acetyltransferase [Alicyclobacillus macrosporangiidus]|uniref:Acetyltransferase (GNAT) domain-containing protein n=1 Tax=Alicyclobacillus macrosporangiidus TaxID=392015 RepID=A0A1I7KNR0_9BACL|nr:GNAT family N-acetyltransferase [Alicyclobacillus macrosporangiidus]SFU99050.1 Acetyltransferase (GNAT) domain-containing protein [Alicyclobacillus macrosporangiidus]
MVEYLNFENYPDEPYGKSMCRLHNQIFTGQDSSMIAVELQMKSRCFISLAVVTDKVVGYKIGYEDRTGRFYSWLGGVDPEFRRQGIASELMRRQHEWCRGHGYRVIRTHTKNKWRDMLILNIRHGFDVIGTYTDEKGQPKIILEKRL